MMGAKKKSSYSGYAHDAITDVWTHTNLAGREAPGCEKVLINATSCFT
jgi:hypothetical protein